MVDTRSANGKNHCLIVEWNFKLITLPIHFNSRVDKKNIFEVKFQKHDISTLLECLYEHIPTARHALQSLIGSPQKNWMEDWKGCPETRRTICINALFKWSPWPHMHFLVTEIQRKQTMLVNWTRAHVASRFMKSKTKLRQGWNCILFNTMVIQLWHVLGRSSHLCSRSLFSWEWKCVE